MDKIKKGFWKTFNWKLFGKWFLTFAGVSIFVNFLFYLFDTETEFSTSTTLRNITTGLLISLWFTWGDYIDKQRGEKSGL